MRRMESGSAAPKRAIVKRKASPPPRSDVQSSGGNYGTKKAAAYTASKPAPHHAIRAYVAHHKPNKPFTSEGPAHYKAALARYAKYAKPGPYQTQLHPEDESYFRQWLKEAHVPFNPDAHIVDYDMRGFYVNGGADTWKPGSHFPDTYKTPYDTTFSRESKYATHDNPYEWRGNKLVNLKTGRTAFRPKR